ncbi:MAG TPA: sensor histidine kinase, partial [Rhodothermales bacterium]
QELIQEVVPAAGANPEAGDVLAFMGEALLGEFVKGSLRLRNHEHRVRGRSGSWRHFVVSLQGVRRDGNLTHLLGSTLETTAYAEVEQRTVSALEKQREELGRELHDVVGQLLTGIRLLSSNLARDTTLPPEKIRLHATRVSQMAEEAHLNLRQINRGLSAAHLQHVRLDDALHDLAEFVGSMPTVDCSFDCEEAIDELDPEKKLQIYRIAQEAVNNALKHSGATQISIQWRRVGSAISLAVSDNGAGFDEKDVNGKTLGLHSMRYRARLVDADLQIRSMPGKGTTVQCLLPA